MLLATKESRQDTVDMSGHSHHYKGQTVVPCYKVNRCRVLLFSESRDGRQGFASSLRRYYMLLTGINREEWVRTRGHLLKLGQSLISLVFSLSWGYDCSHWGVFWCYSWALLFVHKALVDAHSGRRVRGGGQHRSPGESDCSYASRHKSVFVSQRFGKTEQ